ncbi:hypothetical protein CTZ27_38050 [Streptomyces griseocarneus]|nr:hypothetical protein CTZ27_38050 [Streptomyces griseocarneus]
MDHPSRGCVLLLDGTPDRRRGAMPNPTLHAVAGADPRGFVAADAVDVVHLPGAAGQQSVLAYLQNAAAGPGPLLVWLTGRLMASSSRKGGGEVHLALSDSTPGNVRYTGLPWTWLTRTLAEHPGPVLVLADVEADTATWPKVAAAAERGHLSEGVALFGVVTPAPPAPAQEAGPYTRAFLEALRHGTPGSGPAMDVEVVHQWALTESGLGGQALPLAYGTPGPVLRNPAHHARTDRPTAEVPEPAPEPETEPAAWRPVPPAEPPARDAVPTRHAAPEEVPAHHPAADVAPGRHAAADAVPVRRAVAAVPDAAPVVPAPAPERAAPAAQLHEDLLPGILAAARAGRHNEAAAMAAAWEQQALRRYGPSSPEAGLWTEVRADLARLAGDHARAAELWMTAARTRLERGGTGDAEAVAAVKRAHYCWQQSGERAPALAAELLALWERVPGGEGPAAQVRAHLRALQDVPPAAAR